MTKAVSLKVGDLVVRYGKVLNVTKINQDTVEFKPYFIAKIDSGLTFTLKLKNAYDGHIRQLMSKSKVKSLLQQIIKKTIAKLDLPSFDIKNALSHNQLENTLWAIKILWLEKQKKDNSLTSSKLTIFRQAMAQASEEIAAINQTPPETVERLIISDLNLFGKI